MISKGEIANLSHGQAIRVAILINDQAVGALTTILSLVNRLNVYARHLNDNVTMQWYIGDNVVLSLTFPYGNIHFNRLGGQIDSGWTVVQQSQLSIKEGTRELLDDEVRNPQLYLKVEFESDLHCIPSIFAEALSPSAAS